MSLIKIFKSIPGHFSSPKPTVHPLVGRTLTLNLAKCRRFQCGGFQVGPNNPTSIVSPEAQTDQIARALADGRLLDITDHVSKGIKTDLIEQTGIQEEETTLKAYLATDAAGNRYTVIPKDKDEQERFEQEIANTGTLRLEFAQGQNSQVPVLSQVKVDEIDPRIRGLIDQE